MYVSFFDALVQGPSILLPSKRLKAVPLDNGTSPVLFMGFYSIEVVAAPTRPGFLNWVIRLLGRYPTEHFSSLDRSGSNQTKMLRKSIIADGGGPHHFDRIVLVRRRGEFPGLCNGFASGRRDCFGRCLYNSLTQCDSAQGPPDEPMTEILAC